MQNNSYRLRELIHNHELLMEMVEDLIDKVDYLNNACEDLQAYIEDIEYHKENNIEIYTK